jgi:hypothetical protein
LEFWNLVKAHLAGARFDGEAASQADLARYLNFSISAIRKWREGAAIPEDGSPVIESIGHYFNLDDEEKGELYVAAIRSRIAREVEGHDITPLNPGLLNVLQRLRPTGSADAERPREPKRPREASVIYGRPAVLSAMAAALRSVRPGQVARVSLRHYLPAFEGFPRELVDFRQECYRLRRDGAKLKSTWRLYPSPLACIERIHDTIGVDEFLGRNLVSVADSEKKRPVEGTHGYEFLREVPSETLIVNGMAMIVVAAEQSANVDSAIVIRDDRQIAQLEKYFDEVFAAGWFIEPMSVSEKSGWRYRAHEEVVQEIAFHAGLQTLPHPERGYPRVRNLSKKLDPVLSWERLHRSQVADFYRELNRGSTFVDVVSAFAIPDATTETQTVTTEYSVALRLFENLLNLEASRPNQYQLRIAIQPRKKDLWVPEDHVPISHCVVHNRKHVTVSFRNPETPYVASERENRTYYAFELQRPFADRVIDEAMRLSFGEMSLGPDVAKDGFLQRCFPKLDIWKTKRNATRNDEKRDPESALELLRQVLSTRR